LATSHLVDSYETLLPRNKHKINPNKKNETNIDFQYFLNKQQGGLK
jgi:hypothetical protein